jgi:hypothetical protein
LVAKVGQAGDLLAVGVGDALDEAVLAVDRRDSPRQACLGSDGDSKRWELVCDRGHAGFGAAAGTGGCLALLEGRTSAAAITWPNKQPALWRAGISH